MSEQQRINRSRGNASMAASYIENDPDLHFDGRMQALETEYLRHATSEQGGRFEEWVMLSSMVRLIDGAVINGSEEELSDVCVWRNRTGYHLRRNWERYEDASTWLLMYELAEHYDSCCRAPSNSQEK
jgi:hypothetical protein